MKVYFLFILNATLKAILKSGSNLYHLKDWNKALLDINIPTDLNIYVPY